VTPEKNREEAERRSILLHCIFTIGIWYCAVQFFVNVMQCSNFIGYFCTGQYFIFSALAETFQLIFSGVFAAGKRGHTPKILVSPFFMH